MNVRYAKSFGKDLKAISNIPQMKRRLLELIERLKAIDSFEQIQGIRKIDG